MENQKEIEKAIDLIKRKGYRYTSRFPKFAPKRYHEIMVRHEDIEIEITFWHQKKEGFDKILPIEEVYKGMEIDGRLESQYNAQEDRFIVSFNVDVNYPNRDEKIYASNHKRHNLRVSIAESEFFEILAQGFIEIYGCKWDIVKNISDVV